MKKEKVKEIIMDWFDDWQDRMSLLITMRESLIRKLNLDTPKP